MKKGIIKFLGFTAVAFALILNGCANDDDPTPIIEPTNAVIENLKIGIMTGNLEEDFTMNPATTYTLTGSFIVKDGITLTIPSGTQILADNGGTDVYIAVLKGGKININGTTSNPVIMTSIDGNPGDWGGLTICGKATTTAGIDAEAEVGGFIYGGSDDTDSSGSIKNLVITGTGAQINSESQYNGVSFYAVGSGTVVENVAVINGSDDGVEFFGGTVSVKNLFLQNNEDDAIDWTEGWNGTIDNAYVEHTISGFSTVVEGDKDNKNPKINNLTAISTVGGTALQFKKQSGATITGLSLTGYETSIDMKDGGPLTNVIIDGENADPSKSYNAAPSVDVSSWSWLDNVEIVELIELGGVVSNNVTLDATKAYRLTGSYIVEDGGVLTIPAGVKVTADAQGTDVYIAVLKGGKIFIEGTESNPVIMSSADGNPGDWGGLTICGKATTTAGVDAEAEVGGFIYGGSDDADNSGSIKNLVITGTGAQINSESQYNGISFYAVGSGTVVENIAVINGSDDGVEFFGGTVSAKNLFLQNNEDDAIDWTEGWNGTVENAYVEHTIEGFSTVIEGDKTNNNPKIINLTAVSTVGGTALQFKKQSGATITGLSLSGYETSIDMKDNGPLANVQIDGEDANPAKSYNNPANVDPTAWTWIGTEEIAEVVELSGEVTGDVVLSAANSYRLTGSYIVKDGGSLTIPAGTKITATAGGVDVYIAVLTGGKLFIDGTETNPVIITSDQAKPGDWGGLTICGKATTSAGVDAEAEVGGFIYGGTDDADNSGSINYLAISGTGAQINSESQYNGISLYAVGSGTTIDNIAVFNGSDDGIEFFGGTVSVSNIYLENNEDDSVDWTEGWNGKVTNTYISHTVEGFSTAFEGDKVNNNPQFENVTAISTVGGTALQFKKQSGATIINLYLEGYDTNIDMKDDGPLANVQINGADANPSADYKGTKVDISIFDWALVLR